MRAGCLIGAGVSREILAVCSALGQEAKQTGGMRGDAWQNIRMAQAAQGVPAGESPLLDGQVLLAHILGKNRSWVLARTGVQLAFKERGGAGFTTSTPGFVGWHSFLMFTRVTGNFWIRFYRNPAGVDPRPETELLVEQALSWLEKRPGVQKYAHRAWGCGLAASPSTGSANLICIIALNISPGACKVARANAQKHRVDGKIKFGLSFIGQ